MNTYGYVGSNPLHWIDPFGLELTCPDCHLPGQPPKGPAPIGPTPTAPTPSEPTWRDELGRWLAGGFHNEAAKDLGDLGDAANDSNYKDGDGCPPCDEWKKSLNKAYHALEKQDAIKPGMQVLKWTWFWAQVKAYEKECGPYEPPPSFDDIYQR